MASNANIASQQGQTHSDWETDAQDLTQSSEKELRLPIDVGNPSSGATPPPSPSPSLICTLQNCLSNIQSKTSPRGSNNPNRARGGSQPRQEGIASFAAASQDQSSGSSMCGTGMGYFFARETESSTALSDCITSFRTSAARVGSLSKAYSTFVGNNSTSEISASSRMAVLKPNPQSAAAAARNRQSSLALVASTAVGNVETRVAKPPARRRKRASKKRPTQIIEANAADFRATVQQLTGCSSPAQIPSGSHLKREKADLKSSQSEGIMCPQAQRINNPMDIDERLPTGPLQMDIQATSAVSSVCSPTTPLAMAQAPGGARFSYCDSNSGGAKSSDLNYCMGYDRFSASFSFVDNFRLMQELGLENCNTSQWPVLNDHESSIVASIWSSEKPGHENSTSKKVSCAPVPGKLETKRKDDLSRENSSFSAESHNSSSDNISKPAASPQRLLRKHMDGLSLDNDEDLECTAKTQNMVDSWLSPSDQCTGTS